MFGKAIIFLKHTVTDELKHEDHCFFLAEVLWHNPISCLSPSQPDDPYYHVWEDSFADSLADNSFIPVSRIMSAGAVTTSSCKVQVEGISQNVIVSVPVGRPFCTNVML